jgi:soluble lytic murein transglycosylase-like protein
MRPRWSTPAAAALLAAALVVPASAQAAVPHVVAPGETLWTIAYANNFTTRALAAFNGLGPESNVILGSTINIPTVAEAAAALAGAPAGTTPTRASTPAAAAAPAPSSGAPGAMGAYVVRPGDTLSGLAARSRVPMAQMAYVNGLDPDGILLAGTVLKLPTGAALQPGAPAPARRVVPAATPTPTPGRVSSGDIAVVANRNGVPASLASAIAWQESGFNNAMVSSANARGVMQVMPGTWDWVQHNLARRQLDPASPIDNVGAGVLYLGHLLGQTGGDPALAAAGYYQGLSSVRRIGMLPETRQYVANVLALRGRFGG